MAPRQPVSRPQPRANQPTSFDNPYRTPHGANKAPTKKLKRADKHATLLSRINKSNFKSKILKRRRPNKELGMNLEALADALPENQGGGAKFERQEGSACEVEFKIKHKSLKIRPGAGKRKEKLIAMEMERFKKNMALMSTGSTKTNLAIDNEEAVKANAGTEKGNTVQGSSAERWAAIRGFISQTMERKEDLGGRGCMDERSEILT